MPARLLPFLLVVGALTVLPGPDMALVTRNGVRGGRGAAWFTGLGCALGLVVWAITSVAGLAALLASSGHAFDVLRIVGAGYLLLLGAGSLRSALVPSSDASARRRGLLDGTVSAPSDDARAATCFRQGLASNLLNPKIALLFLTLLPQFVSPGEARAPTTAVLGLVIIVVDIAWWAMFSLALDAVARALGRTAVRRLTEGVVGTLLIALALRVAVDR